MPAPLKVDWGIIRTLYAKGYNWAQISKQTGHSHNAIRQYAGRHGWQRDEKTMRAVIKSDLAVKERAESWTLRMMSLCESQMSQIETKSKGKLGIYALETLVRVANTLDLIARRTFGLDTEHHVQHTHLVSVGRLAGELAVSDDEIIDVETEPTVPKQDSESVLKVSNPVTPSTSAHLSR